MIITHENKTYAKGKDEPGKVRNLSATHRKMVVQNQLRCVEQEIMSFAYKLGRSEKQREERRNKR